MIYQLEKEEMQKLNIRIKEINEEHENQKYVIELKRKDRSYRQHRFYWGGVLPALLYFIRDDIKINDADILHIYIKEMYAYSLQSEKNYYVPIELNGKKRYACTFTINMQECTHKEFQSFMVFIERNLNKLITLDVDNIDDLVTAYSQVEYVEYRKLGDVK